MPLNSIIGSDPTQTWTFVPDAAAFEIQERLKAYNKKFVNRDASPYISRLGAGGECTCKRTVRPYG